MMGLFTLLALSGLGLLAGMIIMTAAEEQE